MGIENRLIVCYLFGEPEPFENAWHGLSRLHREYGDGLFLHKYGVRLLDAPRHLADYRLLALIVREASLRVLSDEALARLATLMREEDAGFVERVPHMLTAWFANLSEWQETGGPKPTTPRGLALVNPDPILDPSIIAEVSDDGGQTWRPMTEEEREELAQDARKIHPNA